MQYFHEETFQQLRQWKSHEDLISDLQLVNSNIFQVCERGYGVHMGTKCQEQKRRKGSRVASSSWLWLRLVLPLHVWNNRTASSQASAASLVLSFLSVQGNLVSMVPLEASLLHRTACRDLIFFFKYHWHPSQNDPQIFLSSLALRRASMFNNFLLLVYPIIIIPTCVNYTYTVVWYCGV